MSSPDKFTGLCDVGTVDAAVSMDVVYLRADFPGRNLPAVLSASQAFELGHWLLSAAEELRLEAGE